MRLTKSQASFEFIMTYGWAVFVALAAVGTLAYFGAISPDNFLPEHCSLPAGITCIGFRMESQKATLILQNGMGKTITISQITVADNNDEHRCAKIDTAVLGNGGRVIAEISCDNPITSRMFIGVVNITYTIEDGLSHKITGNLRSKVEDAYTSASSNETIAQGNSSFAAIRIAPFPNLYNVSLKDADGILYFIILDSTGYPLSGGSASCLQEAVLGPFSVMPNEFPIITYYNDCKNSSIDYEFNASMPP